MTHLLLTVALTAIVVGVALRWGAPTAVMAGFIGFTCLQPRVLLQLTHRADIPYTTLSAPDLELHTYHVMVIVAILLPGVLSRRTVSLCLALVPVLLACVAVSKDDVPVQVVSGIVQWAFAVFAWSIGSWVALQRREGRLKDRAFMLILALPVVANAVVVFLQLAGTHGGLGSVSIGSGSIERVSGLEGHSGNLGKILLLLLVLILPLTVSKDRFVRRGAVATVALSLLLTGLTYSRANVVAVGAAIAIWFVLQPGANLLRRVTTPVVLLAAALPFVNTLVLRNEYDPDGGSRPILRVAAWEQVHMTPWFGVGPNNYQNIVGQFSEISARLPVHNTFLLVLVEAGLFISIVIAIPLIRVVLRCIARTVTKTGPGRRTAVAFVAVLPGLIVVLLTGQGIVHDQLMLLLFFVLGYCNLATSEPPPVTHGGARPAAIEKSASRKPAMIRA